MTVVIDDPAGITLARLMTLKQAVRLEATGMRHSSGRSMRKVACTELGLPRNTSYDDVVGALAKEIDRRMHRAETMAAEISRGLRK